MPTDQPPTDAPAPEGDGRNTPPRPRKRRLRRVIIALLVLLVLVAVFGPWLASTGAGRAMIVGRISGTIPGTVQADRITVSWLGAQEITGFALLDPSGQPVAEFEKLHVGASLIKLLRGDYDLGVTELNQLVVSIDRDASGSSNLDRALGREGTDEKESADDHDEPEERGAVLQIPASLAGRIKVTDMVLHVTGAQSATIRGNAELNIEPETQAITMQLDATAEQDALSGQVKVTGKVSGFDAEGTLHLSRLNAEVNTEISRLPAVALDTLMDLGGLLHAATGEWINFKGRLACPNGIESATLSVSLLCPNGRQEFPLKWADNMLTMTNGGGAWTAHPAFAAALQSQLGREQTIALAADVPVTFEVARLSIPVTVDAATQQVDIDLANAATDLSVELGDVVLTGDPALGDATFSGLRASVSTEKLGREITFASEGDVTLHGDGGSARINGTIGEAISDDGRFQLDQLTVNVAGHLDNLPSAVIDHVAGTDGAIVEALGERFDVDLTSTADDRQVATIIVRSRTPDRFDAVLPLQLKDNVLSLADGKATVKGQATPELVARHATPEQIGTLQQPVDYALDVTELSIALPAEGESSFDSTASKLAATLDVGNVDLANAPMVGSVRVSNVQAAVTGESLAHMITTLTARAEPLEPDGPLNAIAGSPVDVNVRATGGLAAGGGIGTIDAASQITSQRINADAPLRLTADRVALEPGKSAQFTFNATPEMLSALGLVQAGQPTLAQAASIALTLDALDMPLGGAGLGDAKLSGHAKIDQLMLGGAAQYEGMGLTDTNASFNFDGVAKKATVNLTGQTQLPQHADAGSILVDATLTDVVRDGALALADAPIDASVKIDRLPTAVLTLAGPALADAESIVGPMLSVEARAKLLSDSTTSFGRSGTVSLTRLVSDGLNVDTATELRIGQIIELTRPATFTGDLSPEAFEMLTRPAASAEQTSGSSLFTLSETAKIKLTLNKLRWALPPADGRDQPTGADHAVNVAVSVPRLALKDVATGQPAATIRNFKASIDGDDFARRVALDLSAAIDNAATSSSEDADARRGSIAMTGTVLNLMGPDGSLRVEKPTANITAELKNVPVAIIADQLGRMGKLDPDVVLSTLGANLNTKVAVDLKEGAGPLTLAFDATHTRADFAGELNDGVMQFRQPLTIELDVTEELGRNVLKRVHVLFETLQARPEPITLVVDHQGLYIPIRGFSVSDVRVETATLNLGQLVLGNGGFIQDVIGLAQKGGLLEGSAQAGEPMPAWFTPLVIQIKDGSVTYKNRLDMLVSNSLAMATWGKVELIPPERLALQIGFTHETLRRRLKNVGPDEIFTVPIRGTAGEPEVDWGAALLSLGTLIGRDKAADSGETWVSVLADLGQELVNKDQPKSAAPPPPSMQPLPWTEQLNEQRRQEQASKPPAEPESDQPAEQPKKQKKKSGGLLGDLIDQGLQELAK